MLDAAGRAGAAWLAPALAPLAGSVWPEVAWRFSRLTRDGCPVELGFSTHTPAVRATLEVAGPECGTHARLDAACALLQALGLPSPDAPRVAAWRALQAGAALRWGSWVGLRHEAGKLRAKLYVELSPDHPPPWPGARTRMLGWDAATAGSEQYASLIAPDEASLRRLLAPLPARAPLLAVLSEVIGLPLPVALRWVSLGASVAEGPRIALFCRARAVRGGAAALRDRFARQPVYDRLLGPVADAALPDHGVLSFVPREEGTVEVRAGISAAALAG